MDKVGMSGCQDGTILEQYGYGMGKTWMKYG